MYLLEYSETETEYYHREYSDSIGELISIIKERKIAYGELYTIWHDDEVEELISKNRKIREIKDNIEKLKNDMKDLMKLKLSLSNLNTDMSDTASLIEVKINELNEKISNCPLGMTVHEYIFNIEI